MIQNIKITPTCGSVSYTGRWEVTEKYAAATACGSSFTVSFKGESAVLMFDVSRCEAPFPHIYVSVDGGAMSECVIDSLIRVRCGAGRHVLKVMLKSSLETQNRWSSPIASAVFLGCADTEPGAPEKDTRPVIEFAGDSVTEGSSVFPEYICHNDERWLENLVWTNDVCASYSYKTSKLLNMRGVFMGYGSTGVTVSGGGGVPRAAEAYPFVREGVRYAQRADIVVLNYGANDRSAEKDRFMSCYRELLHAVSSHNPRAALFAVSPFCGAFVDEISSVVESYNRENASNVRFVDASHWIPHEPLHPSEESHRTAAERLSEIIRGTL